MILHIDRIQDLGVVIRRAQSSKPTVDILMGGNSDGPARRICREVRQPIAWGQAIVRGRARHVCFVFVASIRLAINGFSQALTDDNHSRADVVARYHSDTWHLFTEPKKLQQDHQNHTNNSGSNGYNSTFTIL